MSSQALPAIEAVQEVSVGERWGLILAGGDGMRLRSLTRIIAGDERPKQFCPILGRETLLDRTRHRAALAISPGRTMVVVTRAHEQFYVPLLARMRSRHVVIQPENRGTAPAILYGLLRLAAMAPGASVAILPSDHYVSNDAVFMGHVDAAFEALRTRPELVVMLGIAPESPETEYGWIEPGRLIQADGPCLIFRVQRFWEKPSHEVAETLHVGGSLWNSFVMVARVSSLLTLVRRTLPDLYGAFAGVRPALDTLGEEQAVQSLYSRLPSTNFSHQVLERHPESLAVLRVNGVDWSDWGEPGRVMASLERTGTRVDWAVPAPARSA